MFKFFDISILTAEPTFPARGINEMPLLRIFEFRKETL
jgi:hypothetical protein